MMEVVYTMILHMIQIEVGKVVIISIDQNIYGSGLSPNSVFISGSTYYLRDDGEGNYITGEMKEIMLYSCYIIKMFILN
jgi:hypothetical protein